MRQGFGQEALARQTGGAYGTLDRGWCAFDFHEHVHGRIPLDPHCGAVETVFRDLAIDAQRLLVTEVFEDYARLLRRTDLDFVLLAMLVTATHADGPFPSHDAERLRPPPGPPGRPGDPQPPPFLPPPPPAAAGLGPGRHLPP